MTHLSSTDRVALCPRLNSSPSFHEADTMSMAAGDCEGQACSPWSWASDPAWSTTKLKLQSVAKVDILELCAGAGTALLALKELLPRGAAVSVGQYDVDSSLRPILELGHEHGQGGQTAHLGREANLLAMAASDLPSADVIVAGPPCPPWSSLGKKESFNDKRADVFTAVMDIIAWQAGRPKLKCFVLENVMGITNRAKDSNGTAPVTHILARLQSHCGSGWSLQVYKVNSLNFGLPQSRSRVYIVGRRRDAYGQSAVPLLPQFTARMDFSEVLSSTPPAAVRSSLSSAGQEDHPQEYTPVVMQNIAEWKELLRPRLRTASFRGQFQIFPPDRTPSHRTSWMPKPRSPGECPCLTATGPMLHILSLGEGTENLSVDRAMTSWERAALQGFPKAVCARAMSLSGHVARRIFGNAMSLPVIGIILGNELSMMVRAGSLGVDIPAVPISWRAADHPKQRTSEAIVASGSGGSGHSAHQSPPDLSSDTAIASTQPVRTGNQDHTGQDVTTRTIS